MNSLALSTKTLSVAFALAFLVAFSFSFSTPFAHAAEEGEDVIYTAFPTDSGSATFYPNDYSGGTTFYPNTYTDFYPNSYTDYTDYGYSGGSSWMPGFSSGFGGGWFMPGTGGGLTNTNTNVNTNTNTCTAGSCNTAINAPTTINAPIVNNASPSYPVYTPVYSAPSYPVYYNTPTYNTCTTCGCPGYPSCYRPTPQPYVTLAAVPYTGLDLGTVGTALYWGFLVLWCLLAAYLIAVKKIQNRIAHWFVGSAPVAKTTHVAAAPAEPKAAPAAAPTQAPAHSGIDPFVLSQVNRGN